jgi:flagellar biosynthesis/type III secretory pathway M-ring protein FliF/YscJ
MVALAVILLVLVAVLVVAIVVSNPQIYELSIFGAIIPANSAGIFFTGAVAMAVTILAVLLLRMGIRRARARRDKLKALEASDAASGSTTPAETSTTTTTSKTSSTTVTSRAMEPEDSKEKSDPERQSPTTPAERQAMLQEADELTREEPQK